MFRLRWGGRCGVHTVSRLKRGSDGSVRNRLVLRHFSGVFVTLLVTKIIIILGKWTVTYGEGMPESTFLTKHQTPSQTE
jgi:hypothetical protein